MNSSEMKSESTGAKINNKNVLDGKGHLQPGINNWIGVFLVRNDLLEGDPEQWASHVIEYEGPFNCRSKHINGKGRAKIIHIRPGDQKSQVFINVEGIGEPELEEEPATPIRFSYNANL